MCTEIHLQFNVYITTLSNLARLKTHTWVTWCVRSDD